jgi:hypothetical protein
MALRQAWHGVAQRQAQRDWQACEHVCAGMWAGQTVAAHHRHCCHRAGATMVTVDAATIEACYALRCVKARRWRFGVRVLKHALRSGGGLVSLLSGSGLDSGPRLGSRA